MLSMGEIDSIIERFKGFGPESDKVLKDVQFAINERLNEVLDKMEKDMRPESEVVEEDPFKWQGSTDPEIREFARLSPEEMEMLRPTPEEMDVIMGHLHEQGDL